ncbi:MAG TPA: TolC family protein, partial [Parvularculaceae bacterium]|nr:TolC family protein [Parvularculaceae bacterium]
ARLAAARARVSEIRESMRVAEIRYEEFFKTEPGILSRPSFDAVAVGSRGEASAMALLHHPEIAAAAARSDKAKAEYKAEKASRLPEVRASVNAVKYDLFGNSNGNSDYDVRAGVNMNYDLYSGGARGAAIKRAAELARQQQFDEDRVRQDVERDAAIAYEKRISANERLDALADSLVANYQARALIAERFRVARGELIDVLQSENDYFEAGVAYLSGLADRDMSTYALMEHTGDLLRYFSPQPEYANGDAAND